MSYLKNLTLERKLDLGIFLNIISKFSGLGISFITVPIALMYLGHEVYGIWITLFSVVGWINFFDFGLGHGLRNKLGEALAKSKIEKIKSIIDASYTSVIIISVLAFLISLPFIFAIDWGRVLNTNIFTGEILVNLVFYLVLYVLISFVLNLIKPINYAYQTPQLIGYQNLLQQLLFLFGIFLLTQFTHQNVLLFCHSYGLSMLVSTLLFSFLFFFRNPKLLPKRTTIKQIKETGVLNLGAQFFLIQISVLILQSTDNIIIAKFINPKEVVPYSIALKLFSLSQMLYGGIFLNSLRSSITYAYNGKKEEFIASIKKRILFGFCSAIIINIVLFFGFDFILRIWLNDPTIIVPRGLKNLMFAYSIVLVWNGSFIVFINALGKLKGQLIISIFQAIINIPLSIILIKSTSLGSQGVILATIICMIPMAIYVPVKYLKIS